MKRKVRIRVADTSGNITIFVLDSFPQAEYARVARALLAIGELGGEQVAFVTGPESMEMCGLEFCGNASRAFALMCAETGRYELDEGRGIITVRVSGTDTPMDVSVDLAESYARVRMPGHKGLVRVSVSDLPAYMLVDLDGIVHAVIEGEAASDELFTVLRDRIAAEMDPPAIGVMFCDSLSEDECRIVPVVYVKDVNTVYHEGSCASGTTAYAIAMSAGKPDGLHGYEVQQPAGMLHASAEVRDGRVTATWIAGQVDLHEPAVVEIEA